MPKKTGSRNESWDWKDTSEKISMGERVGKYLTSLQETACVHIQERELIAYLKMYKILFPEDTDFIEEIEKRFIPAVLELGYGRWYRDVITDLALALSLNTRQDRSKVSAKSLDL